MRPKKSGFTLVELLVVITIIGILMSLIFPAVQVITEAANMVKCLNNVKNLGTASVNHRAEQGYFPSGGWGWAWAGDPNLGFGPKQCGGWMFSILPYLDEKDAWALGSGGSSTQSSPGYNKKRVVHTLPVMNCPIRRQTGLYPITEMPNKTSKVTAVARLCYAINAGSGRATFSAGPDTIDEGLGKDGEYQWPNPGVMNGISYLRSRVATARDGDSKTYLIGEKSIPQDQYFSIGNGFENRTAYSGWCVDNFRTAYQTPQPDFPLGKAGSASNQSFGSGHGSGMSFAFCDGSTRNITFAVDGKIHKALANRRDSDSANYKFIEDAFFELNP